MIEVGSVLEDGLVETCLDPDKSRPRVRALHEEIPFDWRVEFPRGLREIHPIGTRFRCDLKLCQKHNSDGSLKGQPYLRADVKTITLIEDYSPEIIIQAALNAGSKSGRSYSHIAPGDLSGDDFMKVRSGALEVPPMGDVKNVQSLRRSRSEKVKAYVHLRANGTCECCGESAPFIAINGKPYLEVHHINAVADGGDDSIYNTAAICPNCHTEISHGVNGDQINMHLIEKIKSKESTLASS